MNDQVCCPKCNEPDTIYVEYLSRSGQAVDFERSMREESIVTFENCDYGVVEEVDYVCVNCNHNFETEEDFLKWIKNLKKKMQGKKKKQATSRQKRRNKLWK